MKFEVEYKHMVDNLEPSLELVKSLQKSEEKKIMKFSKKKIVIVALASCMVLGTTAFAAENIAQLRGYVNVDDKISDYSEAVNMAEENGSEITIPNSFSNGYVFGYANQGTVEYLDESDNMLVKSGSFSATYKKNDMPDIYMSVDNYNENAKNVYAVESKMIGDVEVSINQATYKLVPGGYELTEEDKQKLEDPHYQMSEGCPDGPKEESNNGVSFVMNGKYYILFSWDNDMTADEWYEMAEELLEE